MINSFLIHSEGKLKSAYSSNLLPTPPPSPVPICLHAPRFFSLYTRYTHPRWMCQAHPHCVCLSVFPACVFFVPSDRSSSPGSHKASSLVSLRSDVPVPLTSSLCQALFAFRWQTMFYKNGHKIFKNHSPDSKGDVSFLP